MSNFYFINTCFKVPMYVIPMKRKAGVQISRTNYYDDVQALCKWAASLFFDKLVIS